MEIEAAKYKPEILVLIMLSLAQPFLTCETGGNQEPLRKHEAVMQATSNAQR